MPTSYAIRSFHVSGTEYERFKVFHAQKCASDAAYKKAIRYGQSFYNYFKLHKMHPTLEIDRLWESDSRKYVESFVDFSQ